MTLRGNANSLDHHHGDGDGTEGSSVIDDISVRGMANIDSTAPSNSSGDSYADTDDGSNNTVFLPNTNDISIVNSTGIANNFTFSPSLTGVSNFTNNSTIIPPPIDASSSSSSSSATTAVFCALVPFAIFIALCLSGRRNVPSREHWRGAAIRARAQRIYQQRELRRARKAAAPEERLLEIAWNMYRMQIVSKDAATGQWKLDAPKEPATPSPPAATLLGSSTFSDEGRDLEEGLASPASPQGVDGFPGAPTHLDQLPQTKEESPVPEQKSSSGQHHHQCENSGVSNDSDDDVCHICLDTFEVGDMVMWSRQKHGDCKHVFHEGCLLPWLLEKRENECPSCRSCFIRDRHAAPENQPRYGNGGDIDQEQDVGDTVKPDVSMESSDPEPLYQDDDADPDEGYSFVIANGLIGRVPNHYSSLSVSVPFRRVFSDRGQQPSNRCALRTSDLVVTVQPPLRRRTLSEGSPPPSLGGGTATNTPSSSWDEDDASESTIIGGQLQALSDEL